MQEDISLNYVQRLFSAPYIHECEGEPFIERQTENPFYGGKLVGLVFITEVSLALESLDVIADTRRFYHHLLSITCTQDVKFIAKIPGWQLLVVGDKKTPSTPSNNNNSTQISNDQSHKPSAPPM